MLSELSSPSFFRQAVVQPIERHERVEREHARQPGQRLPYRAGERSRRRHGPSLPAPGSAAQPSAVSIGAVTDERETLTYELFGTAARELAEQVAADGYEPDLILSIARGGLFLGGALGYALDVKNLFVMNVEFYTGVDERLDLPVVLPPDAGPGRPHRRNVLVADDVADTGKTLELVRDFCSGYVAEVRTAVVYEKPQSVVQCDYVWRRTDRWIDFPWSTLPPVVRRSDRPAH